MEAYEPRAFRFIELLAISEWRMNSTESRGEGNRRQRNYSKRPSELRPKNCRMLSNTYKLGFIGAHGGRDACFVFVDYWGNENELFHHVFLSRSNDPEALAPAKSSDSSVCVWDLGLQFFEREAWIKHVLRKANAPAFLAYLDERLNEKA